MHTWANDKARFNHDNITNGYLHILKGFYGCIEIHQTDEPKMKEYIDDLDGWDKHSQTCSSLLDRFLDEMSPRSLFHTNDCPLYNCEPETKNWLGEYTHQKWLNGKGYDRTLKKAEEALAKVDNIYEGVKTEFGNLISLDGNSFFKQLWALEERIKEFKHSILSLRNILSEFPQEVEVVVD